jgi:hypothetical protein
MVNACYSLLALLATENQNSVILFIFIVVAMLAKTQEAPHFLFKDVDTEMASNIGSFCELPGIFCSENAT